MTYLPPQFYLIPPVTTYDALKEKQATKPKPPVVTPSMPKFDYSLNSFKFNSTDTFRDFRSSLKNKSLYFLYDAVIYRFRPAQKKVSARLTIVPRTDNTAPPSTKCVGLIRHGSIYYTLCLDSDNKYTLYNALDFSTPIASLPPKLTPLDITYDPITSSVLVHCVILDSDRITIASDNHVIYYMQPVDWMGRTNTIQRAKGSVKLVIGFSTPRAFPLQDSSNTSNVGTFADIFQPYLWQDMYALALLPHTPENIPFSDKSMLMFSSAESTLVAINDLHDIASFTTNRHPLLDLERASVLNYFAPLDTSIPTILPSVRIMDAVSDQPITAKTSRWFPYTNYFLFRTAQQSADYTTNFYGVDAQNRLWHFGINSISGLYSMFSSHVGTFDSFPQGVSL